MFPTSPTPNPSTNIFPDDQEGDVTTKVPDLLMSVENYSNDTLYYDLKWTNIVNTLMY